MQEIQEAFLDKGINPPQHIELDGRLKRFKESDSDKKKSGWMIGWNNTTNAGETFSVVVGGSMRTNEFVKYQSNGVKLDKYDKAKIQEQIKKGQEEYEQQKRIDQEEAAKISRKRWDSAKSSQLQSHRYIVRKNIGIAATSDLRAEGGIGGSKILVPMRDVDGNIWGLQTISEDGDKRFESGQRVSGTFHTIGANVKEASEVYICEGFATGASIYEAINKTVVVAFNAKNLKVVAQALFEKYPDKAYIVCADNDQWTTVKDVPKNVGMEAGNDAVGACVGKMVFPTFESLDSKPTDFNDLHCLEGLDKVREQILKVEPEAHYIICLGYNEEKYYVYSNVNLQVQSFSASQLGNQTNLQRLQSYEYWESLFPGQKGGVRWGEAANWIQQQCHDAKLFSTDLVRGTGAWMDNGRPVFHSGDSLFCQGRHYKFDRSFKSRFLYRYEPKIPSLDVEPASDEEAKAFSDALECASWKRPEGGVILAAWMALAPISGALEWRPHLWMTGPAGTGKSWLMEHVCSKLLRGLSLYVQGATTEAGLRQKQKASSLPVIFDEFETNDERSGGRVRMILELARQASSDNGAIVCKGTPGGDALEFRPHFGMLVSSVRVNLIHEEDSTRFTMLELQRTDGSNDFDKLKDWAAKLDPNFGVRLARRSFDQLPTILANYKTFLAILGKRYTMRFGQQWGSILAGAWSLRHGNKLASEAEATAYVDFFEKKGAFQIAAPNQDEQDEIKCLDHLWHSSIEITDISGDRVKKPVLEVIRETQEGKNYSDQLERLGIKVKGDEVFVIQNFEPLKTIYSKTKWSGGYTKALSRIKSAEINVNEWFKPMRRPYRCIRLKLSLFS